MCHEIISRYYDVVWRSSVMCFFTVSREYFEVFIANPTLLTVDRAKLCKRFGEMCDSARRALQNSATTNECCHLQHVLRYSMYNNL